MPPPVSIEAVMELYELRRAKVNQRADARSTRPTPDG
jgi:hypothetical protein